MHRLLLINPNTSATVTATLAAAARAAAPAGATVTARTAAFGAAYLASETGSAIAAHAALDAWAADAAHLRAQPPSAVLIGCFGDPGLAPLRELAGVPVHGLAEASMAAAARRGRFAIVTGGRAWAPMLRRLARDLGFGDALAAVVTVDATGAMLAADPALARTVLREAVGEAIERAPDTAAVIVGGAALAGVAGELQADVAVPLLDSVRCGVEAAWASATAAAGGTPPSPSAGTGTGVAWQGLTTHLHEALASRRAG